MGAIQNTFARVLAATTNLHQEVNTFSAEIAALEKQVADLDQRKAERDAILVERDSLRAEVVSLRQEKQRIETIIADARAKMGG